MASTTATTTMRTGGRAETVKKLKVAVVYHIWPHYRLPVVRAMEASDRIEYTFFGSGEPLDGVVHADTSEFRHFVRAPFRYFGRFLWQPEAIRVAITGGYDAIIYLGDPNFASNWVAATLARARAIPVLFWTHGWLRTEPSGKRQLRNLFFGLADHLLIYAERGKRLGTDAGFPSTRMSVVYNSLDVDRADDIVERIESGALRSLDPRTLFANPERPLLICTARITAACRFDLLLDAAAVLETQGRPVNVLLVGDGPERERLAAAARTRGLAVHFFGACYDEEVIGQLIYHADLTVSPGKIGLTAMHSLMYGTPAITHDNLDEQMPEAEAIQPGRTGAFFLQHDHDSLALEIGRWLESAPERSQVRTAARGMVHAKWHPSVQATIIEQVLLTLTAGKASPA